MGFDTVLADWRSSGREDKADVAAEALLTFRGICPQAVENLDTDPSIIDAARGELLDELLTCNPADGLSIKRTFESFCRSGKKKSGPEDAEAGTSTLGHTMPRSTLEQRVGSAGASGLPATPGGLSPSRIVDRVLRVPLDRQKDKLRATALRQCLMWSFYDPGAMSDPFTGIGKSAIELHRRLGLGHIDLTNAELLLLGHDLPGDIVPHTPTTFDAETFEFFRPGGRTKPLSGPNSDGMPEVVHDPVTGENLVHPIERAV